MGLGSTAPVRAAMVLAIFLSAVACSEKSGEIKGEASNSTTGGTTGAVTTPDPTPTNPSMPANLQTHSLYRSYNPATSDHLISLNANEGRSVGYGFEGAYIFFTRPDGFNRNAIYRCYIADTGGHFISWDSECESQTKEGLLGYVSVAATAEATLPVYRCYHPTVGRHLMTTDQAECTNAGYQVEMMYGYIPAVPPQ